MKQTNGNGKTKSKAGMVAVAAGVGVAAAAGAYFLYGKNGKKNRQKIKNAAGWAMRAKEEVLEKIDALKDVNHEKYQSIIEKVGQRYRALKNIDPKEIATLVKELKGHWKSIQKQVATTGTGNGKAKAKATRN